MKEAIDVRKYQPENDKAFVFATWLRNYKQSSYFAKRIRPTQFFAGHHAVLEHLTNKPTTQIAIACPKGDDGTILGYLAFDKSFHGNIVAHFIFVKEAFRNMGVATELLRYAGIELPRVTITHWTYPIDEIVRKHPEIIYNPYYL
jgi:RimJ/RimL family protein N-acetyltransferase